MSTRRERLEAKLRFQSLVRGKREEWADLRKEDSEMDASTVENLRLSWQQAIKEETHAVEIFTSACVEGTNTPEMLAECKKASMKRQQAFAKFALAKVKEGAST